MWGKTVGEGSKHGLKQSFFCRYSIENHRNKCYLFISHLLSLRHFAEENTR